MHQRTRLFPLGLAFLFSLCVGGQAQTMPGDPNHLPQKIGGEAGRSNRVDTITVSGKVRLEGFPAGERKPVIYVAAYNNGRFAVRRQVSESGSYSMNDVPRGETTIVVEIDHAEVANQLITSTPAAIVYQDFTVNWQQYMGARAKPGVVSTGGAYERSRENQERLDRGMSEIKKGSNDAAVSTLKPLVATDPKDFYAWTQLGNAYFLKKDNKNAEASYLRALSESPDYLIASVNLGKLYLSDNANEKAIEVLTKAVGVSPNSADAQHYLGEAYLAIKKGSKAVVFLNEAIRLDPVGKAEIHLRLAALYGAAGLKPRAAAEYQAFLNKVPDHPRREEFKKYISENPPGQ